MYVNYSFKPDSGKCIFIYDFYSYNKAGLGNRLPSITVTWPDLLSKIDKWG